MKLTTRFAIIFALYASINLAAVGLLAYNSGRDSLHAATISELSATAIEKQAALKYWVEDKQRDIALVAAEPAVIERAAVLFAALPGSAERAAARDHLVAEIQPRILGREFVALLLLDPNTGQVVASTDPSEEGKFKGDRLFFINGKVRPYVQNIYYSVSLREPAMTASAPLIDENGQLLGVLAGRLNLEEMTSIINRRSGLRETEDAFLVNTSKLFVTQPYLVADPAVLQQEANTEAVNRCLMRTSGTVEADDYRGVPAINTYHWLPERDLCLIVKIDQAEAYGPARAFGQTVAAISALALLVAVIVAVGLARSLTRPILALQAGVTRFGQGQLEIKLPETSDNELGELAREFNQMAASLLEKDAELRAHTETLERRVQERTKELHESHTQLSRAEQIGYNGSWQWYIPEDRVVWSDGLYQVFGLTPQAFGATYAAYLERVHPDDLEFVRQSVGKALQEHRIFEYETRIVRPDGQIRSLFTRGEVVLDEQGTATRMIGVGLDITERKQAEEALRQSEARYRMLFESNPHPMWVYDLETLQFLAVNDTAVEHYGYSRDEFLSMTIKEIRPAEEIPALMTDLRERQQNLHAPRLWRHLKKDGTLIDVEITSHSIHWEERPARPVLAHDITQRKQAEEALRDSEARYRLATHATKDVIWEWNSQTKQLSWTDNAELAFGYSPQEIGPDESWWDDHILPEDRQRVISDLNAIVAGSETIWSGEYRFLRRDGSYADVSDHAYIDRDPAGNAIRMVGAMSDITERKRAEEALRESEEKIQNIIKHSSSMFYTHTPDGVLIYVSPQSRRILDCEPEEAMVSWHEFLSDHPANRQGIEVTQRAIDTGHRQEPYDLELITRKGRRIWVQVDESPVVKDGKTTAIVGSLTDITERKHAEDALREKERLLSEAQRIGHIGSWNYDIMADTLKYSDEMYRLFDVSTQEFQHNSEGFLGVIHSSDRPMVARWLKNIRVGSQAGEIEFLIFRRNGELRYIRCRGAVEFDKTGKPKRFIGTGQDVTERKLAEIQIQQQIEHLTALRKIDEAIISSFDLHSNLNTILSQLTSQLHVDAADILLLDPEGQMLTYGAGQGFRTQAVETARISTEESQAWRAAKERRSIYVQNLENKPQDRLLTALRACEDFICYFGLPLIVKGKVKGVLEVFHRTPLYPYAEWLDFLNTLSGQAAIAIENATLFVSLERSNRELSQAYDATIEGWSRALDLRDKETVGHTQRVTEMTLELARAMGLPEKEWLSIRRGALLHDIGKMGVPDQILFKPGALTEEEWAIMRSHAQYAYDLLKPITFLAPALDIPYCHHERWDGTGYPRGLKGEEIPLVARLFAVVDVWDALRSDRPYRQAWSIEKAREYIRSQAGSHFDPRVVECFLELFQE